MEANVTVYLACVLFLGIAAQWIAWRLRLPSILLLLGFGFLLGWLANPDDVIGKDLLFPVVSLSVAVILLEGGMSLRISELKDSGGVVFWLVTVGVLMTWLLSTAAAYWVLDFDFRMATLLGAILVVSGPTVIIPLLQHVRPVGRVASIIKWEGIVNDPIGAILAVLVFEAILAGGFADAAGDTAWHLLSTLLLGAAAGLVAAWILVALVKRYWIPDYLHGSFFLAVAVVAFTFANWWASEAGLVAVTVLGIALANQREVIVKHVIEFKENLRVLLISTLFIVLASRIHVDELAGVGWRGVVFLLILIVVVRPLMVLFSTLRSDLNRRERLFLAWIHPRGIVAAAVSSLFALELTSSHAGTQVPLVVRQQAEQLAPLTFMVIVGSVTIYGLTSAPLARWLGLSLPNPQGVLFAGAASWIQDIAAALDEEGFEVMLVDSNYENTKTARMRGLSVCFASILSEHVHEEQDLAGLGRLLAMTPNNEVNALAGIEFADHFGRAEVYQLAVPDGSSERHLLSPDYRPGRELFSSDATYAHLAQRFAEGAQVKTTRLTGDFSYSDFQQRYGDDALPMFLIDEAGLLIVCATDKSITPSPGHKLIALVRPIPPGSENVPKPEKAKQPDQPSDADA